jgi:O-antigen/teichoic acid export membrane protein
MTTEPLAVPATPARRVLAGGVRVFLAESLLIPTGLLTAAYLARRLGPEGYGIFMVAAALVAWVEWSLTAVFSRASVKFVAEAVDWRPIGSTIVSAHLALATAAAALVWALAEPAASLLGTPALAGLLRLFALDIPPFCLAQAHRNILIGIGDFSERALAAAARWVSRLLLVVLLVELGLSVEGAILGSIGASLIELAVCRIFVRPAFSARAALQVGRLWGYVAPLLLSTLALRLYDRLDLLALTALGGTPEQAGHYGAAQNLSILPNLFALSFAPLLLATLTRAFRDDEHPAARRLGRGAMRGVLLLIPFAGLGAGAAPEIVGLVFGPAFAPAAPLIPPLLFAAVALVMVAVTTAILIAAGRPGVTVACTAPLPVLAAIGYLLFIPRYGSQGAALVTLVGAMLAALALVAMVYRECRILPPAGTMVRSGVVCAGAYAAAVLWPASGALALPELGTIAAGIVLALLVAGEFTSEELATVRSWRRPGTPQAS